MSDLIEIFAAVLAAFGIVSLFERLKLALMYPKKLRRMLHLAVIYNDDVELTDELRSYVKYLAREQKISDGRLIIITKSGIIDNIRIPSSGGVEIVQCREDNAGGTD